MSFWATVKDSTDPAVIQTYLDRFPQGTFAALAQILVANLKREAERKAAAAAHETDLRKAEEAKRAAVEVKAASDRKAAEATQAGELRKAQEEAKQARLQLEAAEAAMLKAEKAMLEAKKAAEAAKSEREAVVKEQPAGREARKSTDEHRPPRPDQVLDAGLGCRNDPDRGSPDLPNHLRNAVLRGGKHVEQYPPAMLVAIEAGRRVGSRVVDKW